MHPFWEHLIEPLLDAAEAKQIVEVGSEQGRTTGLLLARARRVGGTVHAIDPSPRFDVSRVEIEHGARFRFHRAKGVDVLGDLGGLDAALIDGDHNWHTVNSELELLAGRADADANPMPLVLAHDVGWPYGRRDMYYDPRSLPDAARHDAARAGLHPGRPELGERGINAEHWNATHEGGPRNGVLTAIEDFTSERKEHCELIVIPGWHGLGVLVTESRLRASPRLQGELARVRSPDFLRAQLERIERARILAAVRTSADGSAAKGPGTGDLGMLEERDPAEDQTSRH